MFEESECCPSGFLCFHQSHHAAGTPIAANVAARNQWQLLSELDATGSDRIAVVDLVGPATLLSGPVTQGLDSNQLGGNLTCAVYVAETQDTATAEALGVESYLVYFGDGRGYARSNIVGGIIGSVQPEGGSVVFTNLEIPSAAQAWLVFALSPDGESEIGRGGVLADASWQDVVPGGVEVGQDEDLRPLHLDVNVTILAAADETMVDSYAVYFAVDGSAGTASQWAALSWTAAISIGPRPTSSRP